MMGVEGMMEVVASRRSHSRSRVAVRTKSVMRAGFTVDRVGRSCDPRVVLAFYSCIRSDRFVRY